MKKLQIRILRQVRILGLGEYQPSEEVIEFDEATVEKDNLVERFAARPDIVEVIGWIEETKPKAKTKSKAKAKNEETADDEGVGEDTSEETKPNEGEEATEDELLGDGVELDK